MALSRWNGRFGNLLLLAAAGMAVYLSVSLVAQGTLILDGLARLGTTGVLVVLSLSLANYTLRFLRWHWYLGAVGARPAIVRHLLYYLGGFSLTVSPGKAGEAVRSWYLRPYGVGVSTSLAALFVERVLDISVIVVLASLILTVRADYWPVIAAIGVFTVAVLLLVTRNAFAWIPRTLGPRLPILMARPAQHLEVMLTSAAAMLSTRRTIAGFGIGLLAWGSESMGLYLIARSLGIDITPAVACGIYAMGALGGVAAFFMPGGIGGAEAAMTGLLILSGASSGAALAATVLCRLATLWFAVVVGLGAVGFLRVRTHVLPEIA